MRSFFRRRPSPAILISSVALFMSLGGVGYAATQLPHNSVGAWQLRNHAVTYKKIMPNAVGSVRANTRQLQARVWKKCAANMAMTGAERNGNPDCSNVLPASVGTTSNTATVPTTNAATGVTSTNLAAGDTYLGLANPMVTVTPPAKATTPSTATVSCTLTVGSNTDTRTVTITTPAGAPASESIPLQLTGTGGTAAVSCKSSSTDATAPAVSVTSAVNAIQVQ